MSNPDNKERQFVHVWDIFGGKKPTQAETDAVLEESLKESELKKAQRNSGNSDISYGAPKQTLAELKAQRRERAAAAVGGTKKRDAPRPPVLVDVDVGIAEQGLQQKNNEPRMPTQLSSHTSKGPSQLGDSKNKGLNHKLGLQYDAIRSDRKPPQRTNSLDQASSGIDTDESIGTPKGSVKTPVRRSTEVESGSDSGQEPDLEPEDQEMTLDFGDEGEVTDESRFPHLYRNYHGEDFAKYLDDEDDAPPPRINFTKQPNTNTRYRKKSAPKPPSNVHSPASTTSSKKMKDLIYRSLGRNKKRAMDKQMSSSMNNIHSFSWADSKMGVASLEGENDEKNWWSKETLSAQTATVNRNVLLKAKPKKGLRDVDNASCFSESDMTYVQNSKRADADFESFRKNIIYNSSATPQTKQKKGILQRITDSWKKNDKKSLKVFKDNKTDNPLNDSDTEMDNF